MALALKMDGVNDYLQTPTLTYTRILFDMRRGSLTGKFYIGDAGSATVFEGADGTEKRNTFTVKFNGVQTDNFTNLVNPGDRTLIDATVAARTQYIRFMTNPFAQAGNFMDGYIYGIEIYNGASLVAKYDMSTGTVQDQSGNGNHATLSGGEWEDLTDTYYLSMDGVDDFLRAPMVAVERIVMDFTFEPNNPPAAVYYLMDARGGTVGNSMVYINDSNLTFTKGNLVSTLKLDGVAIDLPTKQVLPSTRYLLDVTFSPVVTPDANGIEFFVNYASQNTSRAKGRLYRITGYNGAAVVFDYDMSTGGIADRSGNGNHAALTGGMWVKESSSVAHEASGAASSSSSASSTAIKGLTATGAASSSSSAQVTARRATVATGVAFSNSTVTAAAKRSTFASGTSIVTSTATASGNSGAAHTASGEAISSASAQAIALRAIVASSEATSISGASAAARFVAYAIGAASSTSSASTVAIRQQFATGAAVSQSAVQVIESEPIRKRITLIASKPIVMPLRADRVLRITLKGG